MDTAIADGDFIKDGRGYPVTLDGMQEILQRVLIRLAVRKGSFVYDKTLGSRLDTLKSSGSSAKLEENAFALVREALKDMTQVVPQRVTVRQSSGGENLELQVFLTVNGRQAEAEVQI